MHSVIFLPCTVSFFFVSRVSRMAGKVVTCLLRCMPTVCPEGTCASDYCLHSLIQALDNSVLSLYTFAEFVIYVPHANISRR